MTGVKAEQLTLMQAAKLMLVGYRQSKRIWQRYQAEGDSGLMHRFGNHCAPSENCRTAPKCVPDNAVGSAPN